MLMKMIADLHIHSRFSMATSKEGTPENLDFWARKKGISLIGTGDFTHPVWREELKERLVSEGNGLYRLRDEYVKEESRKFPGEGTRFVVSGEISSIYKKNGKTRKVHNVILLPGLEAADAMAQRLEKIGNIHSDGRPILGLDSHDLLEMMLDVCPEGILIPAHIWTPHFSVLGAKSGFDSVEECFEELAPYIHALETGLSSDPAMNWRISKLDRYQLVSNSDAHSPSKLGREANLLDIDCSYEGLYRAIQTGEGLEGTVEFFPEEGKYHFDGHRKCGVSLSPVEAERLGGICPVCGHTSHCNISQMTSHSDTNQCQDNPSHRKLGSAQYHRRDFSGKKIDQYRRDSIGKLCNQNESFSCQLKSHIKRISHKINYYNSCKSQYTACNFSPRHTFFSKNQAGQ